MSKKPLKVPEYFKDLPDDANLNSRDVCAIFGYKRQTSLMTAIKNGLAPNYDTEHKCGSIRSLPTTTQHGIRHIFWKVKTIREWIENVNRNLPK